MLRRLIGENILTDVFSNKSDCDIFLIGPWLTNTIIYTEKSLTLLPPNPLN